MSCAVPFSLPASAFCEAQKKVREHHPRIPAGAEDGTPSQSERSSRGRVAEGPQGIGDRRRVRLKLVPVSPSGTGKTLIRLISSRPAVTQSEAASSERDSRDRQRRRSRRHRAGVTQARRRREPRRGRRREA